MSDRESELACQRLVIAFANAVDAGDYDRVASLFTDDLVFERRGERVEGMARLRAVLAARPDRRVTRHVCTNVLIDVIDGQRATGVTYFLLFDGLRESEATGPLPVAPPATIGEFHDEFVRTPDGWRIRRRTARATFRS